MNPVEMMLQAAALLERAGIEGVFAGGTVLAVHVDEVVRGELRPTVDVDVIVRAGSYEDYQAECSKLMRAGMQPGLEDGDPLCRYRGEGLVVDLMPTPYTGMGTDNPWFDIAMETAEEVELPGGVRVQVVAAAVHLATKVTAFEGRGEGDFLMSKDFEDIVSLVDGRGSIVDEVQAAPTAVREFLAGWCQKVMGHRGLVDAVAGHVSRASGPGREDIVIDRLQQIAAL